MTFLHDTTDPTVALFLSEGSAQRLGALAMQRYPKTVTKYVAKRQYIRGECQGWQCIVYKTDLSSAPLTNSDFERLTA